MRIILTIITYKSKIAYVIHIVSIIRKTWFFDCGRSWFFDTCRRRRTIRLDSDFDVSANDSYITGLLGNFNILNRNGSIPKDTADSIRLEAKSPVKPSSNTVSKLEGLDGLDVAIILVGKTINLVTSVDKVEVDSDYSSCQEFNPIFT